MRTCCVVRAGHARSLPYALVWASAAEGTSDAGRSCVPAAVGGRRADVAPLLHAGELEVGVAGTRGWVAVGVGTGERLEAARCVMAVLDIRVRERTDRRHRQACAQLCLLIAREGSSDGVESERPSVLEEASSTRMLPAPATS